MISSVLLENTFKDLVTCYHSTGATQAQNVLPPDHAHTDSLVFADDKSKLLKALHKKAAIIITTDSAVQPLELSSSDLQSAIFTTQNIPLAMARIMPLFDGKMNRFRQNQRIHPTALIDPTAKIGSGTLIGPYVVIGENCVIEDEVTLGAHTVIESHSHVGHATLIHPLVFVGAHSCIGKFCEIHPHTTIGADGFGFIPNSKEPIKIPQLGRVVIHDHVEIGAHCTIDRATLMTTTLGSGTKLDDHVHVGHNCQLGKNCIIAGGVMIGGSVEIGDHFLCGGHATIRDHIKITSHVSLAGKSGVTNHILESGQYGGYPVEKFRDNLRTLSMLPHLSEMKKSISRLLKHLE